MKLSTPSTMIRALAQITLIFLIHGPRFDRLVLRLEYTLLWGRQSQ